MTEDRPYAEPRAGDVAQREEEANLSAYGFKTTRCGCYFGCSVMQLERRDLHTTFLPRSDDAVISATMSRTRDPVNL